MIDSNTDNLQEKISELDTSIEIFINFSRAVNHDISSHLLIIKESLEIIIEDYVGEEDKLLVDEKKAFKKIINSIEVVYSSLNELKQYYEKVFTTVLDASWNSVPTPVKLKRRQELYEEFKKYIKYLEKKMSKQMGIISYHLKIFSNSVRGKLKTAIDSINEEIAASFQAQLDIKRILDSLEYISNIGDQFKIQKEPVQLATILSNIESTIKRSLRASGKGKLTYPDKFPQIRINRSDCIQIFYNLISNSIKYRRQNVDLEINIEFNDDEIDFKLENDQQYIYIRVSDNGIGIPRKDRGRVFEQGVRLNKNKDIPGTGMGLANIKAMIERYKGSIWIEENNSNEGIVVIIKIPRRYLYKDYYSKQD